MCGWRGLTKRGVETVAVLKNIVRVGEVLVTCERIDHSIRPSMFGSLSLERKVNTCRRQQYLQRLTTESRSTRSNRAAQFLLYKF